MASKTTRTPKRVEVNQRALVDKVLARYPEEFTVFRELLQNADDARAKKVLIEFQTKDYATHTAGANGKTNGINGTTDFPDLLTTKLYKWVVRNNGDYFEDKDWGRLTKIADGNPDEQKIGAFGVGFYSVFGITDSPQVFSGGKSLSIFFQGDQLYTLDDTCPQSEWTSIEMQLKEDMQVPVPKPFDLARFLAATMTFMSCVENAHVSFNDKIFMKIAKSRQVPSSIRVPKDMIPRSKEDTMHIKGLSVVTQEISVELAEWARAAGTKMISTHRPGNENLSKDPVKRKGFWDGSKREVPKVAKVTKAVSRASTYDHPPWVTHRAKYAVYSAEVMTTPNKDLHKGLRAMTKKDPPSHFDFEMVYFSKEEQDARTAEEKRDPDLGSIFRGPQGLFPQLDGEYMSRIFIGQSTAQTTGIGGHMSGRFIPTIERGSIDLTNGHIAKWNQELLYVGGFLARLVYEQEIRKVWDAWPTINGVAVPTADARAAASREKASYAMRYFTFQPSTPDAKVSKILQDAFYDCFDYSSNVHFPILTNSGIYHTKDVREIHTDFTSFMKMVPTQLPTSPGDPPNLVDTLPEKYGVRMYTFSDVVKELQRRILQEEEMIGCLRWWVNFISSLEDDEERERTLIFLPNLTDNAKSRIGNSMRVIEFRNITKFVDSNIWLPWLQSDDALPPDTIPFSFTRPLNRQHISPSLLWQPMTLVDWLTHLISPQIDAAHDIRKNSTYSNRVLGVLGNIWPMMSSDIKTQAKDLMQDVPWIATNLGFRPPGGAYFPEADVFHDLPVVSVNLFDPQILTVLGELGVKRHLDFEELFAKADKLSTWSAMEMIRYLNTDPDAMERLEEIRKHAVFPCDKGKKYCITDLYLPHAEIRPLGLPILDWSRRIDKDSEDEQLLTDMGFLRHPPLEKLIEIAGDPDPKVQRAAFGYLASKFDELYDTEYDPSKYDDMPFIPAIRDGHECVGAYEEVYSDSSWALMGFQKVHPSVDRKIVGRLRMREAPSARQVIDVFRTSPPKDPNTAIKWFAFLATKQVLSPGDLQQIAEIPIVPVVEGSVEPRLVPPRECFIGGSQYGDDHLYRRLFTFVDFEERANRFLKACGVKAKPDCSDILHILIKDPKEFLRKAGADPEKYLVELRGIAVGYEGLSEEDKKRMKNAPIFVGYRTVRSSNSDNTTLVVRDEFQLVTASKILLADDMENRRIFGEFVWLAPQDELLEKLYESVGSGYLSAHIKYNVKPDSEQHRWTRCEEVRKAILEKLPIFMHEFDEQRLKQGSVHRKWDDKSRFLVKGCKDLKVDKRLESNYCISTERQRESNEFYVSAEITTEESGRVVLWLKKTDHLDMYDVAVALCRLLFKTHKKHDVLSLMTILETDKEVLRKRGYDVDRIEQAHEAAKLEDKKKEEEREKAARNKHSEESGGGQHIGGSIHLRSRFLDFFRWQSGSKNANRVNVGEIDDAIKELMEQCAKGQATPEEQKEIRNREHRGAGRKQKDVQYCTELKSTALESVDVGGAAGLIPVWRQITAQEAIPGELTEFANIVHGLNRVLDLSNNEHGIFNIFWHPEDRDLMGFNRNRLIFLNLAHFTQHSHMTPGQAYIHWYYIVVHEIAHNKTPFHDETHELLVSALSAQFLPRLHDVVEVREYLNCATNIS
ncbi:uncharacterized protein F5891DRAFT_1022595 [Suillus fuscotomentosus]|uniref:Sacsin/Nov domain-containing protein n=1 Tax=Suillus fuscotomentosus TaxID=1912939 RepID=A0AAD4EAZ6_9AGAM|nr:uncharacterized protein F5891DRAFT_1022595 [Suillus fuscotomentosus]KAG1902642.1 hypothetical protein F5891DRAFT_1022595 [Suillus fuscotomentosus]